MKETEFKHKLKEIRESHVREIKLLEREFAFSNQSHNINDTISNDRETTIVIDTVKYGTKFGGKFPECAYQGYVLTKKGKPRKDKQRDTIFQSEIV